MNEKRMLGHEESLLYTDMQRIAELRYQLGEVDELEKIMASARAAEVQNNLNMLADDIMIAENQLRQLMVTSEVLISPAEPLTMYRIEKPSDTTAFSNTIVTDYYRKNLEVMEAAVRSERSRFFPEIVAGYFYQDMAPLKGLQGWHAGLNIPLLAFSQSAGIKQARIEKEIAMNELEYMAYSTDMTIENLVTELTKYFRQLQHYNEYALKQADEIIRNAKLQLDKENIGYQEFALSISQAIAIRTGYLEALNSYNQTAIQLEFYAY
jgi:cobalt-zinc-cadmium resistance protein CzcA